MQYYIHMPAIKRANKRGIIMDKYRVENKNNVNFAGKKTSYKIFIYNESQRAYVYAGSGYAAGHNASDDDCIEDFLA
jgi:hypothetical protein